MDANDLDRSAGQRIRLRREALNMTQEQLAATSGMDRTAIGKIERAERSVTIRTLFRIATALRTSMSSLLRGI